MSYFAPYIDSAGFHLPTYQDIVDQLVSDAQSIFGSDIYLGNDSQDYQWISSFASMIYDSFMAAQSAYNSRGPSTAIGSALDIIVGANGIQRKSGTNSTASVTLTGTANTIITGGIVSDNNGNQWTLPTPVTIGADGTATVTATCQTAGAISAGVGDINTIVTPMLGWTDVTNPSAATVGTVAETDAQLRARQQTSTAQPSQSMLEGLEGAIAALSGVTRFKVYQNDTNAADSNGVPAHSVDVVVEGGSSSDIADAIFNYKGIGCGTYGTTAQPITDSSGVTNTINYDILSYVDTDVIVNVKKLTNYTTDTTTAIQTAVAGYENSIGIGIPIYNSSLWGAVLSANANAANPVFSVTNIQASVHLGAQLSAALTSGTAYTSISVEALAMDVPSGSSLTIGGLGSTTTQVVTTSADAPAGSTSITVNSFTANAAYASGTPVSFTPTTSDISVAFNQAARGNSNYVTVNAS